MESLIRRAYPLRVAALVAALLAVAPASAQVPATPRGADKAPDDVRPLLGAWDLELVGQPRKCTLTLGAETAGRGRQVRFPATCRRALPVLDGVAAWSPGPQGALRLEDAQGKPVIAFQESGADKLLQGKGPDGQTYGLDSKAYPRAARRAAQRPAEVAALSAQRPTAVDPSSAPKPEALPGRYGVMRQANRETCKLALSQGPVTSAGRSPAAIEGSCTDTGLNIFDPIGWRYADGRLTLIARKGHSIDLISENGLWRKDPAVGAPLMLKRLP
jgi:hypothetical protein